MKENSFIYLLLIICTISCIKEELPVPAHVSGDIKLAQVEMGANYNTQIFYNLEYNSIVNNNLETDWEIAFECSDSGSHVILNSSIVCSVLNTNTIYFDSITSINGIPNSEWKYDAASGNLDSSALVDYNNGNVYIINRGTSVAGGGITRGYKKIIIDNINNEQYQIRSADLDGSKDTTVILDKDAELNFKAFSLSSNSSVEVFPNKNDWDLMFTAYTHIFDFNGSPLPYRVSGVLINRYNTYVAEDTTLDYNEINYNNIINNNNLVYSNNIDVIGYNWKTYSGSFTIVENLNYIIKTSAGLYFKLRFIDFYNDNGVKGCPKFEFQQLQT